MAEESLTWGKQRFDNAVAWGRDLERRHAWLLHLSTQAVGQVERFYTGQEGDKYKSDLDGQLVDHGVFFLTTGHALLSKPENFIEIGPEEASIYINTLDKLRKAIVEAVEDAATTLRARTDMPELPMALILSALRAQTHALEATIVQQQQVAPTQPAPETPR